MSIKSTEGQKTRRKGTRSTKDIPKDILEKLNRGEIKTENLVEWLAITSVFYLKIRSNKINKAVATGLFELTTQNNDQIVKAHKYVDTGRKKGNVVIKI